VGNVIITGGASGLGAATVTVVARHGGSPMVIDRKQPEADVPYQAADVADTEAVDTAMCVPADQAGTRIDGLFTAARIDCGGKLSCASTTESSWP
jgi:NAD(P)-dependent dehydrogenase (short-subunit alcohol dehydrogenase family)